MTDNENLDSGFGLHRSIRLVVASSFIVFCPTGNSKVAALMRGELFTTMFVTMARASPSVAMSTSRYYELVQTWYAL